VTGWKTGAEAKRAVHGEGLNVYRCQRCQRWHSTINEKAWHAQVVRQIKTFRWTHAHFRPLMTTRGWRTPVSGDGEGFPDFVILKPPRLLAVELKTDDERTSVLAPAQQAWLDAFAACGVETFVWRPKDALDVVRILSGREARERT